MDTLVENNRVHFPVVASKPLKGERWEESNKHVLWGWKRDVGNNSRVVYFSGDLGAEADHLTLDRGFFFYKSRMAAAEAELLVDHLSQCQATAEANFGASSLSKTRSVAKTVTIEFTFGQPTSDDKDRIERLQRRRPRRRIKQGEFPAFSKLGNIEKLFPTDAYVGSGMSYECNLPTLCDMHNRFCLDNYDDDTFTVGSYDKLPLWLSMNFTETVTRFCDVHVGALTEDISLAYRVIGKLYERGLVKRIFTDNVDNMFSLIGVPYERVRGSGVFNERFNTDFESDKLLVVGVAADRREIIKQFRAKRRPITIVNPCQNVSPGVQHLNYVRKSDEFFHCSAHEFFAQINDQLGLVHVR